MSTRTANATASINSQRFTRTSARAGTSVVIVDVTESQNVIVRQDGRQKSALSRSWTRFSAAPCSSYRSKQTSIVRLSYMQIPKSGSLTSNNGGIISLTPEDLRNHSFAVFTINCKCAVEFFGAQRCSYRHFFCTSSFMP